MVKVHLLPRAPVQIGPEMAERLVGVGRIELPTPAMSTRCASPHAAHSRATPCDPARIWAHLFSFGARVRFTVNFGPLCMGGRC